DLVPLLPDLDDVAFGVEDDEAVLPLGVDADLAVRRLPAPVLHALLRILSRAAGTRQRRRGGVTPQSADRILQARAEHRQLRDARLLQIRQLAAEERVDA